ncbi:transposase [Sphingobacterium kitahiroshimense]|uniref:Transposase n=1 Tax=Sphingobacterium kitahiroshimense TaxID=470446 RepID=A0ABV0BLY9_9SPHI
MIKVRKKYLLAFKERAVELSKSRKNISEPARELGISAAQSYKWRKEAEEFGSGSFPGNGNLFFSDHPYLHLRLKYILFDKIFRMQDILIIF